MAQPTPSPAAPGSKTAAPADNEPVLIARDLRKKYGSLQAVDGVSFEVASGEVSASWDRTAPARRPPSR